MSIQTEMILGLQMCTPEEIRNYDKKALLIQKLCNKYWDTNEDFRNPIYKLEYERNNKNGFVEIRLNDSKCIITIRTDSIWSKIKFQLDNYLKNFSEITCGICSIDYNKNKISCSNCNGLYCEECYIQLFKQGKGIITCPYCRNKYGHYKSPDAIERGVKEIRSK